MVAIREKSSIQSAQRRLERKLKEVNITLDEERNRHAEQKEQVKMSSGSGAVGARRVRPGGCSAAFSWCVHVFHCSCM